jgi:hypothetical protein
MDLVTVLTAFSPAEGRLARSRLEAASFHPFVADELSALSIEGDSVAAGGVRLQVPEDEATDAREFLNPPTE